MKFRERILLFIGLGLVLVATGFALLLFVSRLDDVDNSVQPNTQPDQSLNANLKGLQVNMQDITSPPDQLYREYLDLVQDIGLNCQQESDLSQKEMQACDQLGQVADYQFDLYSQLQAVFNQEELSQTEVAQIKSNLISRENYLGTTDRRVAEMVELMDRLSSPEFSDQQVKRDLLNHRINFWNNHVVLNNLLEYLEVN